MTWESAVAVALAALGIAGSLAGLVWTLGRIFRPWMREAAREAAEGVRADVKALGDKLASNDFPHVEARIDRVEVQGREERAAMEARLSDRMERMEGRLLAAIQGRGSAPQAEADSSRRP